MSAAQARFSCPNCAAVAPATIRLTEPGWVVAQCECGATTEITEAEVGARQRHDMVARAVMPASPPVGLPARPVEQGAARLRAMAHEMWRRGAIDDHAYRAALTRLT